MKESTALMLACVERYQSAMDRVAAKLRPGDGILGFGNDPKRSPYHMDFYNELGELAGRLAQGEWPAEEAEEDDLSPSQQLLQEWGYPLSSSQASGETAPAGESTGETARNPSTGRGPVAEAAFAGMQELVTP